MQNVKNLQVAERAKTLAVLIYRTTGEFPSTERFGLTAQMRRAALSIGSNIAEGCGREGDRELARFVQIAMGRQVSSTFSASSRNSSNSAVPRHSPMRV